MKRGIDKPHYKYHHGLKCWYLIYSGIVVAATDLTAAWHRLSMELHNRIKRMVEGAR